MNLESVYHDLNMRTFANMREYRDELARLLGPDYDAGQIAYTCGGWNVSSRDAAGRYTIYLQTCTLNWFRAMCRAYGPIDATNFYTSTYADFSSITGHPDRDADHVSESGSRYWYDDAGVIRESDHWGHGIASCDWYLDGDEYGWSYHCAPVCGFCAWGDFEHK